jgi:hypothetical protein
MHLKKVDLPSEQGARFTWTFEYLYRLDSRNRPSIAMGDSARVVAA